MTKCGGCVPIHEADGLPACNVPPCPKSGQGFRGIGSAQVDDAAGGVGVLAVKQRGHADGAGEDAATLVGYVLDEFGAGRPVGGKEAEFDQLAGVEVVLQLLEKFVGEAAFADLQRGLHRLAEAAKEGFLRAGEGEVIHGE